MNCRMNRTSSALTTRPRYRYSLTTGIDEYLNLSPDKVTSGLRLWSLPSVCQNRNRNASTFLCAHSPPNGCRFRLGIPGRQQQLRLMGSQCFRGFVAGRPPFETAFGKALGGDPEPLAIIGEDSDRFAAAAAEDEQAAGKGIGIELLAAKLCQRVNPLPCVYGFDRNQDAQLRCDLDQDADSSNSRLSVAR